MSVNNIRELLVMGDMRSTGKVHLIIKAAESNPAIIGQLVDYLTDTHSGVRMRAADALEKISADQVEYLTPYKSKILTVLEVIDQKEVQWHWCQMVPRLNLSVKEQKYAVSWLQKLNSSKSSIVRTFALQGLVEFALNNADFKASAHTADLAAIDSWTPAMKARAKKLIKVLKDINE